jgi:hypothetical protein
MKKIELWMGLILFILMVPEVHAVNMDSNQYKIQFGTVNSGGQKMQNNVDNTYTLTSSLGQAAAAEFQSNGFIVKAGFQYIYSRIPFTFTLSTSHMDFGTLIPSTPSTLPLTLQVSFGGAGQYVVTALADGPLLRQAGGETIPFTICNGGVDTCTIASAKNWTSTSAYGFGYSMSGEDVPTDFVNSNYYRPFASQIGLEAPQIVMSSTNVTDAITPTPNPLYTPAPALTGVLHDVVHQSTMTMKVNTSAVQAAGSYTSIIRFLATPSF